MLRLHSLEISGFKSFLDGTKLRFGDGLTAIVGPNGCGKSNLTDAITWVLGEQSAKSLRGGKMEDVIFSGSDKRKPVGMAEVELTMTTDPSFPFAKDGRLRISRQVFREGGSRYRINGKVVRLKEIKDLLMDTGLGIRAYSVIEQGKIGMILSGKPQERRRLLEEAAGITRYKARKRVAEVKLEETLDNLARLDDIIAEVSRSLRSLKRQASAARRYQAKEGEYHDLLSHVLLGRWGRLRGRLDDLEQRLGERATRAASLDADLARDEAALAAGREQLDAMSKELAARHQASAQLGAAIEGKQEFLRGGKQRRREMVERLDRGQRQADERRQQTSELEQSIGSLDEATQEVLRARDEAARRVADDERTIADAQQEVEAAETRLGGLRSELMTSMGALDRSRSELQRAVIDLEKLQYRARFLADERKRLDRQLEEAQATLTAVDERVQDAQTQLDEVDARRVTTTEELEAVLRREAELTDQRREHEAELTGLRQRQRLLAELGRQHEEQRAQLVEALGRLGIDEPVFLADALRARGGWEESVDHFLGDLADAVVVPEGSDALELARRLSELHISGIFVQGLGTAPSTPPAPVDDDAIALSLVDVLDLPPELAHALPPAYLVDSADAAARLAADHPGIGFISRERVWIEGGVVRVRGDEAVPGVLARESELEAIGDEIPRLETRIAEAKQTLEALVRERTRLATEKNRAEERAAELRREIAVAQARRQDAEARRAKVATNHATVATEQDEIAAEVTERGTDRERLTRELQEREAEHAQHSEAFDRAQAEVEAARGRREELREESADRRGQLQLLEQRLESQHQEAVRVRRQITYTEEQLQIWADEGQTLEKRMAELELEMDRAEDELQASLEARTAADDAVLEQQRRLDTEREALRAVEERVAGIREARDGLRGELEGLRVDRAGARQDAEHLSVTYRETFKKYIPGTKPPEPEPQPSAETEGSNLEELSAEEQDAEADAKPGHEDASSEIDETGEKSSADGESDDQSTADGADAEPVLVEDEVMVEDEVEIPLLEFAELAELEGQLARLKAQLERLGPVNVLAATEYEEQDERHGFLEEQRTDVAASVASLKQTIQEINEASSRRFKETFEDVNRTFGATFQKLFRGGEAEMRLFDEDDLLETGIEIVARPPGKRPQNILLLSGGEKALTAIALLFALFQTKPSPFCILDEVDAPLDDVNVLRFVEVLEEMARETQFLVITHNKLTMETADTLYGVTMEEKGVSKLVEVKMGSLHPDVPADTADAAATAEAAVPA
ncbi:MAG: chromosome segregation protein SMC [Acidobacteriota bacterium]